VTAKRAPSDEPAATAPEAADETPKKAPAKKSPTRRGRISRARRGKDKEEG